MAKFRYIALDSSHLPHSGSLTAPDRETAMRILSQNYPVVTALEQEWSGLAQRFGLRGRVRLDEKVSFTQTLATLLDAGLTLKNSLDLLARELRGHALNAAIVQMSSDLGQGQPLSQAMARHPQIFDKLYCSLVLAGETGGALPTVLGRLGDFLERSQAMRDRMKAAMVYPLVVLTFALFLGIAIVAVGVPQLESLYSSLGSPLPGPTRLLVDGFRFVANHWISVFTVLALLAFAAISYLRSPMGRQLVDSLKLNLSWTRDLFEYLYTARFTETLGTLYTSGVPLLTTLDILSQGMGNHILEGRLRKVAQLVQDGVPLSQALRRNAVVAELAVGLIEAGEQSGALDPILRRLSRYYEGKFNHGLQALVALAEPALMLAVGLIVGALILLLGLPFMNLVSILS